MYIHTQLTVVVQTESAIFKGKKINFDLRPSKFRYPYLVVLMNCRKHIPFLSTVIKVLTLKQAEFQRFFVEMPLLKQHGWGLFALLTPILNISSTMNNYQEG